MFAPALTSLSPCELQVALLIPGAFCPGMRGGATRSDMGDGSFPTSAVSFTFPSPKRLAGQTSCSLCIPVASRCSVVPFQRPVQLGGEKQMKGLDFFFIFFFGV